MLALVQKLLGGAAMEKQDDEAEHSVVNQSAAKLNAALAMITPWLGPSAVVESQPCTRSGSINYRNRCTLQVVQQEDGTVLEYALRMHRKPVVIETFDLASARIQFIMNGLLAELRTPHNSPLTTHLTSISFATAWNDCVDAECLVTMHYDSPIEDVSFWQCLARQVATTIGAKQISGRSRRSTTRAFDDVSPTIRDQIYLKFDQAHRTWCVGCVVPAAPPSGRVVKVNYDKPEGAFTHPNASVMCRSLSWILTELHLICSQSGEELSLMELFCGFGAHTLAIQQANIPNLRQCFAVDNDKRLIDAFRANVTLNSNKSATELNIVHNDALKWVKHQSRRLQSTSIMVVDPPRQGLGKALVALINESKTKHLLYVSCGIEALAEDLSGLDMCFNARKCCMLDLFPQTGAVESLLHLERRQC